MASIVDRPTTPAASAGDPLEGIPPVLRQAIEPYAERLDLGMIARAYRFAEQMHRGQKRASGEDYLAHTVEVARILAELHLDTVSIVAGLVHDVVEDTPATLEQIRSEFGDHLTVSQSRPGPMPASPDIGYGCEGTSTRTFVRRSTSMI